MRYIKPIKGFRFSRNLGLFLFSTAIISGQLVANENNKAYGLEALKLPPSIALSPSQSSQTTKAPSKKEVGKTQKVVVQENKTEKNITLSQSSKLKDSKKESLTTEKGSGSYPNTTIQKPVLPASYFYSESLKNESGKEEVSISPIEVETEKIVSPKIADDSSFNSDSNNSSNIVLAKVETVSENQKEDKTDLNLEEKIEAKISPIRTILKKISNDDREKTTPSIKATKNIEQTVQTTPQNSTRTNNSSKKVVKEECPPEWDWFSAPLVFVKDANGKYVIRADKNAPKIVISSKKNSNTVIENKPLSNDFVNKKSNNNKSTKVQSNKSLKTVEAKPVIEAPASSNNCSINKDASINTIKNEEVSKKQTEIVAEKNNNSKISDQSVKKQWFTEASRKMAKIKEMRKSETNNNDLLSSTKASKSESMMKINKLVVEIIKKYDNSNIESSKDNINTEIVPQAPPENNKAECKEIATNNDNIVLKPYVNRSYRSNKSKKPLRILKFFRR